jgi:hypothetical protein
MINPANETIVKVRRSKDQTETIEEKKLSRASFENTV